MAGPLRVLLTAAKITQMRVHKISKQDWGALSENAHLLAFEKSKPVAFDRIDYALLCVAEDDKPIGYITVRELDHESVYWQFGGGFPWAQKSALVARAYDKCLDLQFTMSKRITTKIENTNYPMLRLALSRGWVICGCGHYNGTTLVDLIKEAGNG